MAPTLCRHRHHHRAVHAVGLGSGLGLGLGRHGHRHQHRAVHTTGPTRLRLGFILGRVRARLRATQGRSVPMFVRPRLSGFAEPRAWASQQTPDENNPQGPWPRARSKPPSSSGPYGHSSAQCSRAGGSKSQLNAPASKKQVSSRCFESPCELFSPTRNCVVEAYGC